MFKKSKTLSVLAALAASATITVQAQSPGETPEQAPQSKPALLPLEVPEATGEGTAASTEALEVERGEAFIRIWGMIPPDGPAPEFGVAPTLSDDLELSCKGRTDGPQVLIGTVRPFLLSGYQSFAAGQQTITLKKLSGEDSTPLAKLDVDVKQSSFLTLILTKENSEYKLQLVDHSEFARLAPEEVDGKVVPAAPRPAKEVEFYNFVPGSSSKIATADGKPLVTVIPGSPQESTKLPGQLVNLTSEIVQDGKSKVLETEVDLERYDSLSYLIIQDIYGRTIAAIQPNATNE